MRYGEAVTRQLHGVADQFRPGSLAIFPVRKLKPAHCTWNARRSPSEKTVARRLAARVEVHVVRGLGRGLLTEVNECRASVGKADQHESAAAEVAGEWIRDGKRHADRDGGVDRIAARLENLYADIGGDGLLRSHHAVPGADRFFGLKGKGYQEKERDSSHSMILLRWVDCQLCCNSVS